jgi:hypothetical protein
MAAVTDALSMLGRHSDPASPLAALAPGDAPSRSEEHAMTDDARERVLAAVGEVLAALQDAGAQIALAAEAVGDPAAGPRHSLEAMDSALEAQGRATAPLQRIAEAMMEDVPEV